MKQKLSEMTINFTLGQFLVSILCSEDEKQARPRDELDKTIEKLIAEQASPSQNFGDENYCEPSPHAEEHDRIFKAFGEQINQ